MHFHVFVYVICRQCFRKRHVREGRRSVDTRLVGGLFGEMPDRRSDWQCVVEKIRANDHYRHSGTTHVLLSSSEHRTELYIVQPQTQLTLNDNNV